MTLQRRLWRATYCAAALLLLCATAGRAAAEEPTIPECLSAHERSIGLRQANALGAARAELLACANPSCPEEIREECARLVAEVNEQLPTLVFEAKDREDNDLSAVTITMDGQPLVERLDGTALDVDPGEHRFVFSIEGWPTVEKTLVVREREKGRREKVVLGPELSLPEPPPPAAEPVAPLAAAPASRRPATSVAPPRDHTLRTAGIVIGAVGIVGLGVALYEQVAAHGHYSDSQDAANSSDASVRSTTHAHYERAARAQTSAIVVGALGAAALGSGVVLLLLQPAESESSPSGAAARAVGAWVTGDGGGVSYARGF